MRLERFPAFTSTVSSKRHRGIANHSTSTTILGGELPIRHYRYFLKLQTVTLTVMHNRAAAGIRTHIGDALTGTVR